jgi:hypothetical protein
MFIFKRIWERYRGMWERYGEIPDSLWGNPPTGKVRKKIPWGLVMSGDSKELGKRILMNGKSIVEIRLGVPGTNRGLVPPTLVPAGMFDQTNIKASVLRGES